MSSTTKPSAAIIGSGIAGLAASIRLASKGYSVDVFEANAGCGGKIAEWRHEGFRFDAGPTVFTMPEYLDELFALSGEDPAEFLPLLKPELPFNYFFEDGLLLHFYAEPEKLISELASKTNDDADGIRRYLDDIRQKFSLTNPVFLQNSLHILSNYFSRDTFRGLLRFGKTEVFRTMDRSNRRNFTDDRTVKLFNTFASYLGSNPFKAPGVLNVISHFQLNTGIYLPREGMFAIARALNSLALRRGVRFHFNTPVEKILVSDKTATGIRVNGTDAAYDVVISNADVYQTYKQLLPGQKGPSVALNHPKSNSVLVFLWGIGKKFPQLALHNMMLTGNMQREYESLSEQTTIGDDFTFYLYVSSKLVHSDAPEGCENWYILINAPHLAPGQDWESIVTHTREKLLAKLRKTLGEDVAPFIRFEKVLDPRDHERNTNTAFGAIYGNSFNRRFSVFQRHANFSNRIRQLYFCGGTVHPGSGIPLSLLSAKITTELILKKATKRKPTHAG